MSTNAKVGIGFAVVGALAVGVLFGSRETVPTAPGSVDPRPVVSAYPRSTPTPVVATPEPPGGQCQYEDEYGSELLMFVDTGEINSDLVMCTNVGQTGSLVKNTSTSTVYYLAKGDLGAYWDKDTDAYRNADVRMFRAAMREAYGAQNERPLLTVEPGESVQFNQPPTNLRFAIDRRQQAAWQTAVLQSLVYERAKEQSIEQVEDYFEKRTPTGFAAVTCTVEAYKIGETIGGTVNDPSSLLFSNVYDGATGAYGCATALVAAEEASQRESRTPVLSRQTLLQVSREPAWKAPTNTGFELATKWGSRVIQAR